MFSDERTLGCLAGLATSGLWTATALFLNAAARRFGGTRVNALRIYVAVFLLAGMHFALQGHWVPGARGDQVALLALSGWIGLSIGDQAALLAFLAIGPRLTLLLMTTAPLVAAALGWWILNEPLGALSLLGIGITLSGVAWTILERSATGALGFRWTGVAWALLASVCQAVGLLLSKRGMGHGWLPEEQFVAPQSAALIRMCFAAIAVTPVFWFVARRAGPVVNSLPAAPSRTSAIACLLAGAFFGPFLGMWMSLTASHYAPLGIAQTLASLAPVLILPFARFVLQERITPRAALGALLAVSGCAILFLL